MVFIVSGYSGIGGSANGSLTDTNLLLDTPSLWTESMLWDRQISISSGLGYTDNVLLSALHPRGSAFFVNGLDCLLIRLPLDGWEVEGSLVGEDTRFWRDVGTSSEDSFLGSLSVQREFHGHWKAGLEVLGAYQKQVLDVSLPTLAATALVEGESLTAKPSLRKELGPHWWLQLEMPVTRWWLAAPLDDFWQFGPVTKIGYQFGPRSDVTLGYGGSYTDHNAWRALEYSDGHEELPQKLETFQNQVELAWRQYWDAHQRWRSSTHLVFADLHDNGGGYYNEQQYQLLQELRWQTPDWMIKASADLTCEDYPIQWIGRENGVTLYRDLWDVSLEMERRLYKGLRTFAKVDYQRCLSNADANVDDYKATTVSAGLRYEF